MVTRRNKKVIEELEQGERERRLFGSDNPIEEDDTPTKRSFQQVSIAPPPARPFDDTPVHMTMTERRYMANHAVLTLEHALLMSGLGLTMEKVLQHPDDRRTLLLTYAQLRYEFAQAMIEVETQRAKGNR